jgi:hypothetical protein
MTENTWPRQPPDRIRHGGRCTRRAPLVETARANPAAQPHVVSLCTERDQHDLAARLRDEAERKPT